MKKLFMISLLTLSSGALWAMDENQLQEIETQSKQNKPLVRVQMNVLQLNQNAHVGLDVLGQYRALNITTPKGNLTSRQKEQQFVGALCAFLENVKTIDPIPAQEDAALLSFDSEKLTKLRKQLRQMSKAIEETENKNPNSLNKYKGFGNSPLLKYTMTFVGGFSTYWLLQKLGVPPF